MRRVPASVLLALAGAAHAQADPPVALQRGGTFVPPPTEVDPVYLPLGPDRPAPTPTTDARLTLRLTLDIPLRSGTRVGAGTQGGRGGSPTLQELLRWRPLQDRGWFVQATAFQYLAQGRQRAWDPDFTYAFGYDDGKLGHWGVWYSNWTGTRWSADATRGERGLNFGQGTWTASYRFGLPEPLQPWLLAGDGDSASCHADASLGPTFTRTTGESGSGKVSLALGCRYMRPSGWFAHATAFGWPQGGQQQPWDPDFAYGFGWTRPADPHLLTLQYVNYSGNRWLGRTRAAGEGGFGSGSAQLSWETRW